MPTKPMIRNIDTEFIKKRCEVFKIPMKDFCSFLGKTDNYINSLNRNGCPEYLIPIIAGWLRVPPDDERLFVGGVPMTQEELSEKALSDPALNREWLYKEMTAVRSDVAKARTDIHTLMRMIQRLLKEFGAQE